VIKVIVTGALGRMGRAMIAGLVNEPEIDLCGGVSPRAAEAYLDLPGGGGLIPIEKDLTTLIQRVKPDVLLDFTNPHVAMDNVRIALAHKVATSKRSSG
jgi:4-hydroxy-tetrahydrodipicolinate reductase